MLCAEDQRLGAADLERQCHRPDTAGGLVMARGLQLQRREIEVGRRH
jgi:hypothetical protein